MSHKITLVCDACEQEYLLNEDMEIPPYWIGAQIAAGNKDGLLTQELFIHVCSQKCLLEFIRKNFRKYMALIDKIVEEKGEENNE